MPLESLGVGPSYQYYFFRALQMIPCSPKIENHSSVHQIAQFESCLLGLDSIQCCLS